MMPSDDLNAALLWYDQVRVSEPRLVFTVIPHDAVAALLQNSHVVFLERGNSRAGLEHILLRHYNDFLSRDIDSDGIISLLRHTIANLRPLSIVREARGLGLEYAFDDTLYPRLKHDTLKVAMGFNGFIVSAFVCGLASIMGRLRGVAENSGKAPSS